MVTVYHKCDLMTQVLHIAANSFNCNNTIIIITIIIIIIITGIKIYDKTTRWCLNNVPNSVFAIAYACNCWSRKSHGIKNCEQNLNLTLFCYVLGQESIRHYLVNNHSPTTLLSVLAFWYFELLILPGKGQDLWFSILH